MSSQVIRLLNEIPNAVPKISAFSSPKMNESFAVMDWNLE